MVNKRNQPKGTPKPFTDDVVGWWIKWVRIHNKKEITEEEAKKELYQLQDFVSSLKSLYNDIGPKR